jgi:hypothetical protein
MTGAEGNRTGQAQQDWKHCDLHPDVDPDRMWGCPDCLAELRLERHLLEARLSQALEERDGYVRECYEVEQTLGKALGYPWFKDDQKNFPGTDVADGVCVGEHTPGTIAAEAATKLIAALKAARVAEQKAALMDKARYFLDAVDLVGTGSYPEDYDERMAELDQIVRAYDALAPAADAAEETNDGR